MKRSPKSLPSEKIEGGVAGEIVALIGLVGDASFAVGEAGAVVHVSRGTGALGKADVAVYVQRVPLVMVERTESGREREISEATGDGAAALGDLIGIGEVELDAVREARRTQREFPSSN